SRPATPRLQGSPATAPTRAGRAGLRAEWARSRAGWSARPARHLARLARGRRCPRSAWVVLCEGPGRRMAAPGGEKDSRTGPGGRLASTGGRSRAPGPGTRAGPLQPRGEAGVAAQGGVPVRHGTAEGAVPPVACQANGRSAGAFIGSQPTRAAVVAGSARSVGVVRLSFSRLWCLRPPVVRPSGTRRAPDLPRVTAVVVSPGRTER